MSVLALGEIAQAIRPGAWAEVVIRHVEDAVLHASAVGPYVVPLERFPLQTLVSEGEAEALASAGQGAFGEQRAVCSGHRPKQPLGGIELERETAGGRVDGKRPALDLHRVANRLRFDEPVIKEWVAAEGTFIEEETIERPAGGEIPRAGARLREGHRRRTQDERHDEHDHSPQSANSSISRTCLLLVKWNGRRLSTGAERYTTAVSPPSRLAPLSSRVI